MKYHPSRTGRPYFHHHHPAVETHCMRLQITQIQHTIPNLFSEKKARQSSVSPLFNLEAI
jgi:hypothetical protein